MKTTRKNLDDEVHSVSQASKKGDSWVHEVTLSKIWKISRAMAENCSPKDSLIFETQALCRRKVEDCSLCRVRQFFILRSFECFEKITATKKLHYWYLMASLMMIMVTSDDNDFECLYLKMSLLLFVSMGSSMAWEKKSLLVKPCLRSRGPDSDAIWLCRWLWLPFYLYL